MQQHSGKTPKNLLNLSGRPEIVSGPNLILMVNLGRIHDDRDAIADSLKRKGFKVEFINLKEKNFNDIDISKVAAVELKGCRGWQKNIVFFKEQLDVLQAKIEESGRKVPIINPPEMFHWIDSKMYMDEFQKKGVDIVPTIFIEKQNKNKFPDLEALMEKNHRKTIVIKPAIGSLAANVLFIKKVDENRFSVACPNPVAGDMQGHLSDMDSTELKYLMQGYKRELFKVQKQPAILIQQFCEGLETSAIFICDKPHFVKRYRSDEGYIAHEDFGGQNIIDKNPHPDLVKLAYKVRDSLPDKIKEPPFMRVDMLYDGVNPPLLLEVEAGSARLFLRLARKVEAYARMIEDEVKKSQTVEVNVNSSHSLN